MKTIRVNDDKYIVIHNGEAHTIVRSGKKFSGCGVTGTLAAIKHLILTHSNIGLPIARDSADDMPPVPDVMPPDSSSAKLTGVWHCLHPCAVVAMEINKPGWLQHPANRAIAMNSLDAFGWTKADGEIDFDRVLREAASMEKTANAS